jgi:hypothetical protein
MQVGKAPMLLLDGQPLIRDAACHAATSIISCLTEIASVRSQVEQFLNAGPPALAQFKTVHVLQGEYAVMDTAQEPQSICLCSSEATTCCILALSCQSSGRVGMVHFDQSGKEQAKCLAPLLHGMLEPELYIVGGFTEATECGHRIADTLLSSLEDTDLPVHVRLACIGQLNTTITGAPRCCSLALNRTNVGMSARVGDGIDKGPQAVQRLARVWTRSAADCQNIYDTTRQTLRVPNFSKHLSRQQVQTFRALLELPDDHFLSFVSTSPEHEADAFVPGDNWFANLGAACQHAA